ncbi:S8 family peptidase [Pseudonocardia sp. DLS-67]
MTPRTTTRSRRAALAVLAVAALTLGSPATAWAQEPGWELEAMSVPAAWSASRGAGITVAVVDTGIQVDHEALAGRAEEGPDQLGGADPGAPGYGTHGTAMASQVLDVAPEARVLGLRVITDEAEDAAGTEAGNPVAAGILAAVDAGVGVISLSLGTREFQLIKYSDGVAAAINDAAAKGIVVVAGAGNEAETTNEVSYPANNAGVIAVGASDRSGRHASFSNVHSYVDVLAPGEGVSAADVTTGGRSAVDGTSSSTAYVAGIAALLKSARPELAGRQVEQVLRETASRHGRGHDPSTGYGAVDAAAALEAAGELAPQPALLPAAPHTGPGHLGPGDDGIPPGVAQPVDTEGLVVAGIAAGLGVVVACVAVLLFRRGRRPVGN